MKAVWALYVLFWYILICTLLYFPGIKAHDENDECSVDVEGVVINVDFCSWSPWTSWDTDTTCCIGVSMATRQRYRCCPNDKHQCLEQCQSTEGNMQQTTIVKFPCSKLNYVCPSDVRSRDIKTTPRPHTTTSRAPETLDQTMQPEFYDHVDLVRKKRFTLASTCSFPSCTDMMGSSVDQCQWTSWSEWENFMCCTTAMASRTRDFCGDTSGESTSCFTSDSDDTEETSCPQSYMDSNCEATIKTTTLPPATTAETTTTPTTLTTTTPTTTTITTPTTTKHTSTKTRHLTTTTFSDTVNNFIRVSLFVVGLFVGSSLTGLVCFCMHRREAIVKRNNKQNEHHVSDDEVLRHIASSDENLSMEDDMNFKDHDEQASVDYMSHTRSTDSQQTTITGISNSTFEENNPALVLVEW